MLVKIQMFSKTLILLCIAQLLCYAAHTGQPPERAQVNMEVDNILDYPAADLQALTAALRTHPQAVTFRVTGLRYGGVYPKLDHFTEFYDRRTRTLRYYSYFVMRAASKANVEIWQKTGVTEAQIARAASEAAATPWDVGTAWNELLRCPGKYTSNTPGLQHIF